MTLALSSGPAEAAHDGFHRYSRAWELTGSGFIGVRLSRPNVVVSNQPSDGCTSAYSGHPVYQAQWVVSDNLANWVEFGTGHQCNGALRYHYWGYAIAGNWAPVGYELTSDGTRDYAVYRDNTGVWHWKINSVQKGTLTWDRSFGRVQVGLESYVDGATVPQFADTPLQFLKNTNTGWENWGGQDDQNVQAQMCGTWYGDGAWVAGQNC